MDKMTALLPTLDVDGLLVHHTAGAEDRARVVGARAARVQRRLGRLLDSAPPFEVYVVGPADWAAVGEGVPYGMPMALPGKVIAPLNAAEWVIEHFRGVQDFRKSSPTRPR